MTGFFEGQGEGAQAVPHNLDSHTDVTINLDTLADKQVLKYNSTQEQWQNLAEDAGGTSVVSMDDLLDVEAPTPLDGQAITWVDVNSRYEPVNIAAGAPINLTDILDVTLTGATNGDRLEFDGGVWVNIGGSQTTANPITIGDGADVTNAGLILDAGSLAGDIGSISFRQNNLEVYNINLENNGTEAVLTVANMMRFGTTGGFIDQDFHVTDGKSLLVNNLTNSTFGAIFIDGSNHMNINPPPTSRVNIGGEFFVYTDSSQTDLRFSVSTDGNGHFSGNCDAIGTMDCAALTTYSGGITSAGQVTITSSNPTSANHAARKDYVDTGLSSKASTSHNHDSSYLKLSGGSMSGSIDMNGSLIFDLPTPSAAAHAATKGYVDTAAAANVVNIQNAIAELVLDLQAAGVAI